MDETTAAARSRLKAFWPAQLEPKDIYAMQLLHCYDTCARRTSPWMEPTELFTTTDWEGFEYLRDGKYYFSEGHGAPKATARYALPWLVSTVHHLKAFTSQQQSLPHLPTDTELRSLPISQREAYQLQAASANSATASPPFPLQICFTHREEILYLCSLLGLGCYRKSTGSQRLEAWKPSSFAHDTTTTRPWHVSTMACYLGHVGVEAYAVPEVGQDCALPESHTG